MSDHIANRLTVPALVAAFEQAERSVRAHFVGLVEAEQAVNVAFGTLEANHRMRIDASGHGYHDCFADPERCIERMRRDAWRVLVDRLELRRMLSVARMKRVDEQLDRSKPEPITDASVRAFVARYAADMPDLIIESVREVFDLLRPRHASSPGGKLKTNKLLEVGEKVILMRVVCEGYGAERWRVNYHDEAELTALCNVFSALDGAGTHTAQHWSPISLAVKAAGPDGRWSTDYFEGRAFKNGNLHLRFKRLDLLRRFNQIAGGARLRPAADAAE